MTLKIWVIRTNRHHKAAEQDCREKEERRGRGRRGITRNLREGGREKTDGRGEKDNGGRHKDVQQNG